MGNTVISGILFQPPSPPNPLSYIKAENLTDRERKSIEAIKRTLAKNERHNISVSYLWLYSCANEQATADGPPRYNLIPAVHITHNSVGHASATSGRKYTLLYSHGNAEDLGLIASFLSDLARLLQIDILCYDYSGYGVSTDEAYVAEFFLSFDREIRAWQDWRATANGVAPDGGVRSDGVKVVAGNGRTCHFSQDVFVAPIIHPRDAEIPLDMLSNEEKDVRKHDGGCDFTDPLIWESGPGFDLSAAHWRSSASRSTIDESTKNDDGTPMASGSFRLLRWLSSRHSWTVPSSSETDCYANIYSAHSYLTEVARVPPQHVILYGKSVGSGPTCWLAQRLCRSLVDDVGSNDDDACSMANNICNLVDSREPWEGRRSSGSGGCQTAAPGGVILHSPFLSVIRVVLDVGFTTIGDLFPNVDRVGDFT